MPNWSAVCRAPQRPSGNLQKPTPRHGLIISMLPAEILLMIHKLLPPVFAACLVLCRRSLLEILGNQSLVYLRSDDHAKERRRLVSRLAIDLPDWLLCYRCSVLHPLRSVQLPTERDNHLETAECARADGLVYIISGFCECTRLPPSPVITTYLYTAWLTRK